MSQKTIKKQNTRIRIKRKIRMRISGTDTTPRLSVFKSNAHMYAQLIDDTKGVTLVSASDVSIKKGTKAEKAKIVGENLAKQAVSKGISKVVFDRNGFRYTGRIKTLADEARKAGLVF